jgi:2-aminoadipate transaminase
MKEYNFAKRVKQLDDNEISELLKLVGKADIISFAGGIPDADIFPMKDLEILISELMKNIGSSLFQYGSTEGSNNLKDFIISFFKERKLYCNRDELLITTGSQQGLDIISKIFLNPGDRVIMESPAYLGAIAAIKSYEADIIEIEQDYDGIKLDLLENQLIRFKKEGNQAKFIYVVPEFSNPSGTRLPLEKRKKLIELAEKYDTYIIEDDPYSQLNYYSSSIPFMKSIDEYNRVIYLGTFSKIFVPGLRIAWIIASSDLIKVFSMAKQNAILASNTFGQELIAYAGKKGFVNKQIKKLIPHYQIRLENMRDALEKYFPKTCKWNIPTGGFFFWVKLPYGVNSRILFDIAVKNKVAFVPGNSFYSNLDEGKKYIRLSFSDSKPEDIKKGIEILGKLISNYQKELNNL